VFFNPAVFHAAGANHTADDTCSRLAIRLTSAFGRAMEAVDRGRMSVALFLALRMGRAAPQLSGREQAAPFGIMPFDLA